MKVVAQRNGENANNQRKVYYIDTEGKNYESCSKKK